MKPHATLTYDTPMRSDCAPTLGIRRKKVALFLLIFTSVVAALPLPATAREDSVYVWCLYQGRTASYPGPHGLAAVFSNVFRMKSSDYSRYTNDEANSFESYVDANFTFNGRATVTCHSSESHQDADDDRNHEISIFRRDSDYAVHTVHWSYHGR